MRAPWLGRLSAAAIVAACTTCCAPDSDVGTARQPPATAAVVESTPPLPTLRRTAPLSLDDRAAWRSVVRWPAECEEAFEASQVGEDGGLAIHALAPRVSLVEVLCAGGAYQPSHVYIRFDEEGSAPIATLLQFPVLVAEDGVTAEESLETDIWGQSWLSSDAGELSVLALSRQLADCGIWSRYAIGEQPRLIAAAARLPCAATPGPPAQFTNGDAPSGWRPLSISK